MTNIISGQHFLIDRGKPGYFRLRVVLDHRQLLSRVRPLTVISPFTTIWQAAFANPYVFAIHPGRSLEEALADVKAFLIKRKVLGEIVARQKILVMCDAEKSSAAKAFCFYQGEVHRSLPGSGMMWFGAVLSGLQQKTFGRINTYRFQHFNGSMSTSNYLPAGKTDEMAWLEYETPCLSIKQSEV